MRVFQAGCGATPRLGNFSPEKDVPRLTKAMVLAAAVVVDGNA